MLQRLIDFYKSEPINHWSSYVMLAIFLISMFFILKFFFGKEGRDERGDHIFSKASFISFCIVMLWLILLSGPLSELPLSSSTACAAVLFFTMVLLAGCQCLTIFIMKKIM